MRQITNVRLGRYKSRVISLLARVQPFVDAISNGTYQIEADVNLDGSVDLLDVQNFVAILFDG